ncbi:MAG: glycosyl hydrolase [Chloroflexota bacterium]
MEKFKIPEQQKVTQNLLDVLEWRCIGPHRGGRVVAVAGDVADPQTFYFGACAGGVWKTTDGGLYWQNVSDGFFNTAAVGAIAVAMSDSNVLYAGTGETSIRGNVSHGDGVYKSVDGGRTWQHMGLTDTRHIGKIQIHPQNPDIVYVAALGHAFGPNDERGIFRTRDGGATWERVLHKSATAGSHDLAMDLNNPRILYAAVWQAQRFPHRLESGGPECGLWRSIDGGDSWEEISRKPGLPTGLLGKIGVAASPAKPGRVWALVEADDGAVFRSDDYGESWTRLSEQSLLRTRPWYYMHITADTQNADTVWIQNYSLWKSIDGGKSFDRVPTPHGDDHALWIDPNNNQRIIEGNDGGACVSFNGGGSWSSIFNQPTAQLYHVTTDDQFPYRVYGSQQDNTAISVPSASFDGAIHERDWYAPGGGESGYIAVKPDDPAIVVASGPVGQRAYNDVMIHYNHRTGQKWNITVWPELYGWGVGAESLKYRFQWTFPIMFSQHDSNTLYVASNYLHRSTDLGASFAVISDDLTRNDPDKLRPSGGPITRDNTGAEVYCTIFALAESPHKPGLLWAGTDDGLVHISEDGGEQWKNVTPPDLPEWALISIIEPSPHSPNVAYVAATRYKLDDTQPYLYKTNDYGQHWTRITNGIPDDEFTRVIREDPNRRGLLYAGTETGLYVSFDDGEAWQRMGGNLPVVPIHDLVIKNREMIVATHGRSFWILDDLAPLHHIVVEGSEQRAILFPTAPKVRMRTYGRFGRWYGEQVKGTISYGNVGTSVIAMVASDDADAPQLLDAGQNPPPGIVFHYYLAAPPQTPPAEDIRLNIRTQSGDLIRSFSSASKNDSASASPDSSILPVKPGVNRFHWNLRYAGATDVVEEFDSWSRPDGPLVAPVAGVAELIIGGETFAQPFEVQADPRSQETLADLEQQRDMLLEVRNRLSQNNELINNLVKMKSQVDSWSARTDDAAILTMAESIKDEIDARLPKLINVGISESQLHPSGLHEKFNALFESVDSADYAPPQQARAVFQQLSAELDEHMEQVAETLANKIQAFNHAIAEVGFEAVDVGL